MNTPDIRFKGYAGSWEQSKLKDVADKVTEKNTALLVQETFTNSAEFGVISQRDFFERDISNADNIGGYYVIHKEDFVYNPRISTSAPVGPVNRNKLGRSGIMSPLYTIFRTHDVDTTYLEWFFKSRNWHPFMYLNGDSGARSDRFSIKDTVFFGMPLPLPCQDEQKRIGAWMNGVDNLITLNQRKLDTLKNYKKAMLVKMFPREGQKVPEIRFKGFTGDWEQCKFSDLVLIERGGSPRPIDDFITDAPDGLNWVKIGDAPEQGRYITKTAEKIKPEGLSKTRQVHPGDLILSNSMSFGKPYIMKIDGCIHDGWLLIRNDKGKFNLTFLCHMLGTDNMLEQYRMAAAGSTVNNLNKELVGNTEVSLPSIDEQKAIGEYLESLDTLITLHQRKLDKLKDLKQAMLNKMFVKGGN